MKNKMYRKGKGSVDTDISYHTRMIEEDHRSVTFYTKSLQEHRSALAVALEKRDRMNKVAEIMNAPYEAQV